MWFKLQAQKTVLKSEKCGVCAKRMKFGKIGLRFDSPLFPLSYLKYFGPGAPCVSFPCTLTVPPECLACAWDPQPPPLHLRWWEDYLPSFGLSMSITLSFVGEKLILPFNRWAAPQEPGALKMWAGIALGRLYLHPQCCDDLTLEPFSLWKFIMQR